MLEIAVAFGGKHAATGGGSQTFFALAEAHMGFGFCRNATNIQKMTVSVP
jgi:hypothetical protein